MGKIKYNLPLTIYRIEERVGEKPLLNSITSRYYFLTIVTLAGVEGSYGEGDEPRPRDVSSFSLKLSPFSRARSQGLTRSVSISVRNKQEDWESCGLKSGCRFLQCNLGIYLEF